MRLQKRRRKRSMTSYGSNSLRRHYPDQVQGDPKLLFASISAGDAPQRPCFYVQPPVYTARAFCQGLAAYFCAGRRARVRARRKMAARAKREAVAVVPIQLVVSAGGRFHHIGKIQCVKPQKTGKTDKPPTKKSAVFTRKNTVSGRFWLLQAGALYAMILYVVLYFPLTAVRSACSTSAIP